MSHSFSVYNASAGSGKTFTLAKEYIKILLLSPTNDAFSSILAITFTNKAVGEMKKRILEYLVAFAEEKIEEDYQSFLEAIIAETGLTEEKIFTKSKLVLKTLLQNYVNFDISTIDKFTLKLVKSFAQDLGINAQFEVYLDEDYLQEQAIDQLISDTGEDEEITKILLEYAKNQIDDDKTWDLTNNIKNVAKLLEKETFRTQMRVFKTKSLAEIIEIKKKMITTNHNLKNEIFNAAKTIQKHILDLNIPEKDFSGKYFINYLNKVLDGNFVISKYQSIEDVKLNKTSKFTIEDFSKETDICIQTIYKYINLYHLNIDIIKNLTPLSLLNKLILKITEIEETQNVLLLSKFNQLIYNEIISQPALYIFERIGEKYKHFFIDEFQDTSELQWFNLIPLLDNAISSEDNFGKKGTLMVVGDPKQSIYRFRGGKPELLLDISKDNDWKDKTQNPFNTQDKIVQNLATNYRSYSQIIQFNNDFFKFIATDFENQEYQNLYLNHSSQEENSKKGGCVTLQFIPKNPDNENEEDLTNNDVMVQKTVEKVKKCIENGFNYSEIAILVSRNKEGVWIAQKLTEEGIKVISAESMLLSTSDQVMTIIYFLQLIKKPKDETLLAQFVHHLYPLNSNLKNSGLTIFQMTKNALDFCKKDNLENWLQLHNINLKINDLKSKPLYTEVQELINILLENPKNDAYLQSLLEIIWDKTIHSKMNLYDFLDFWDKKSEKLSIAASEGLDAVVVLSIHKSKGLEFPVVIYPFVNQSISGLKENIFVPVENESLEFGLVTHKKEFVNVNEAIKNVIKTVDEEKKMDTINKLYVALTRAKEQLHIISVMNLKKDNVISDSYTSKYFLEFLQSKQILDFNKLEYIFGTEKRISKPKNTILKAKTIENIEKKLSFNQIKIAKNEALIWDSKQKDAIDFGNFIHQLMQEIVIKDDIENVVNQSVTNGKINPIDVQLILETLSNIVNHSSLNVFFDGNGTVFSEQKIIIPQQNILIPDRMVLFENQMYILDYKTGKKESQHLQQILNYRNIIESMNYKVVQKVLVYIGEEIEVVELK